MARPKKGSKKPGAKASKSVMQMLTSINKKVTRIDHHVNPKGFKARKAKRKAKRMEAAMIEGGL